MVMVEVSLQEMTLSLCNISKSDTRLCGCACVCVCALHCIPQCVAGHQGENPENEGLRGKVDGISWGHTGEAHPSATGHIQHKQEEEGTLTCFVFNDRLSSRSLFSNLCCYHSTAVYHLCFHFQNVTQELDEDLISLNEILEVGFDALHNWL